MIKKFALLVFILCIMSSKIYAFASLVDFIGSAQAATAANLLFNQTRMADEAKALADALINSASLSASKWSDVSGDIQNLGNAANCGTALAYSSADSAQRFSQLFQGSKEKTDNYRTVIAKSADAALDTLQGSLRTASLQGSQMAGAVKNINDFRSMITGKLGRNAGIQAAGQITGQVLSTIQYLKQTQLSAASAQAAVDAYKAQKKQLIISSNNEFTNAVNIAYHAYADAGEGQIKNFN